MRAQLKAHRDEIRAATQVVAVCCIFMYIYIYIFIYIWTYAWVTLNYIIYMGIFDIFIGLFRRVFGSL